MGLDSSSLQAGNKRTRPDDEVYLDNFHVHKRYLSELTELADWWWRGCSISLHVEVRSILAWVRHFLCAWAYIWIYRRRTNLAIFIVCDMVHSLEVMASSLNGLKVGDSLPGVSKVVTQTVDSMDSPALTETGGFSKSLSSYPSNGDELSTLDSYMSDDSDESICYRTGRYCETPQRTLSSLCDSSRTASPLKSFKGVACGSNGFSISSVPLPCTQPKQRVPDAESRFPPSPSDPCYAADLRRAALLRSLQLRAQSPVPITDAAAADEAVDECLDVCENSLTEAEDQCSPCSPNFDELAPEQTACNHDILGSPVHGTYPGQAGRGSGLVRSLLLDGCANIMTETCSERMPTTFEGTVSTANSIMPQTDCVHSRGMNLDCSFSSLYAEEVSDSTEKTGSGNGMKWSSSSTRGDRLCNYFYKGKIPRNASDEDQ